MRNRRYRIIDGTIDDVDKLFKSLNIVVEVFFKLLMDNIEFVDKLFRLVFVAYCVKSGLFVIVEFQSDGKLVGLLIKVKLSSH